MGMNHSLKPSSFLQFLMGFSLLHGIVNASARHDPADKLSRSNLEYNDTMNADADYKVHAALHLQNVMDFLEKAASQVNYNGSPCRESIDGVLMNSTPWVQALVLNDRFGDAIKQLHQITTILSACSQIEVSEAVLDFTQQASKHVVKASLLLGNLQLLKKNTTEFEESPQIHYRQGSTTHLQSHSPILRTLIWFLSFLLLEEDEQLFLTSTRLPKTVFQAGKSQRCVVGGTKCQYSNCGKGKFLSNCATGFAAGVTGGAQGVSYTVSSPQDNPENPAPGTLRYAINLAASNRKGVWITFSHDMVICLKHMLWIKSHTTIDGRGFNVIVTGKSMVLADIHNVILHNFQINGVRDSDAVHIFAGTRTVWVDHLTSFDAKLGLVSVVEGSTDVTISNCHLSNNDFNMLLGASDSDAIDQKLRVTVYRNWFRNSKQRMPHCRWGYCHVLNNLYNNWGYYAIGARAHAKVYSEKNVFCAGRQHEVTPWFRGHSSSLDMSPTIQSTGDLFVNGATFHEFPGSGTLHPPTYTHYKHYPPIYPTPGLANLVQHCSGALFGPKLHKCLRSVYREKN
ncbi:hypothetical protein KI387_019822 [Taxus chinensis]|uniref:Pectate lyase n=1 Tax=Taxus chinensis TaxID=29808 RepID=A0AA38GAL3_TAXCH|nr:hypothetical protein KI387_019822 [Taxus chinensis]